MGLLRCSLFEAMPGAVPTKHFLPLQRAASVHLAGVPLFMPERAAIPTKYFLPPKRAASVHLAEEPFLTPATFGYSSYFA